MHRASLILSISLAFLGLAGCGSPKPIKYYTVQIPTAPSPSNHNYTVDLVVARITGSELLTATPIIYRTGTHEVGTYAYHRWTGAPTEMVQDKLIRLLRKSEEFRTVTGSESTTGAGSKTDALVLRGKLYDFSEIDGAEMQGQVTMEFELYSRAASRVVWTHFYSQPEPVKSKAVAAVVEALDHNLDRGLNEVAAELSKYLAANPPGKS